jgi:hypothetical protein
MVEFKCQNWFDFTTNFWKFETYFEIQIKSNAIGKCYCSCGLAFIHAQATGWLHWASGPIAKTGEVALLLGVAADGPIR